MAAAGRPRLLVQVLSAPPIGVFYAARPDLLRKKGWRPDAFTTVAQAVNH